MILAALLLIALLLPGCAASFADEEIDQGQQRGLLDALQKLRLLDLGRGRLLGKRDSDAPVQPLPQQVKQEKLYFDTALAGRSKSASQDLDSLLRNRMKRDQSLMVQINVFNSAGKGCWKRRKVLPHSTQLWPELITAAASSTAVSSFQDAQGKATALLLDSSTVTLSSLGSQLPTTTPPRGVSDFMIDYNRSLSVAKEVTPSSLGKTTGQLYNVQGEKANVNISAGSITGIPVASSSYSYSEELQPTLLDQLFPLSNVTRSQGTPVAPMWKPLKPEPFFPNDNFNPDNIKGASNKAFGHGADLFSKPPPVMKITIPAMVPADGRVDNMEQPDSGTAMYFPTEALDDTQNSPCVESYGVSPNCDGNPQMYRAKASGIPGSPFDRLMVDVAAAVGGSSWERHGAVVADEPCQCSDADIEAAIKKRASTARVPQKGLSARPQLAVPNRLWPVPLVQKPVAKVFGSLRYPPTTDNAYEYATTYVYEDYYPTAYYEALPEQQKLPPAQYRPKPKLPSQPQPQPQAQPMKRDGVGLFHQPDVGVYAPRVPKNNPAGGVGVDDRLLRRLKYGAGPTRTSGSAKKRFPRDLKAIDGRTESLCPCRTTPKPPCTKTRKKCVKKPPCTKKVKKCKKPCPKKVEQPNPVYVPQWPNILPAGPVAP